MKTYTLEKCKICKMYDVKFMFQIWPFTRHCYEKEKANNFF